MIGVAITDSSHLLHALLVSGSLGALIGLERQWDDQFRHHTHVLAGLRTFTLWALLGTLCSWFSQTVHALIFVAGFSAMAIWISLSLLRRRRVANDPGFTTGAAGMLTFLIGSLVFWQMERVALVLAVSILILLALKPTLHSFTRGVTLEDVRAALKFAAVSGVILPLVPDEALGPYGAFNPRTIWLMVSLVCGVGFTGYLAVRLLGQRIGIALTGLLGGIASSTATTLTMSRQSRERPEQSMDCALAVLLACTVMNLRVGLLVGIVSLTALSSLWLPLTIATLPGFLWCVWRLVKREGSSCSVGGECPPMGNPLRLTVALQFGAIYAVIVFLVKVSIAKVGNDGVLLVSGLSGLADLDAITLSLSQMLGSEALSSVTASRGILIAIFANTVVKAGLAFAYGSSSLRREVIAVLGVTAFTVVISALLLVR